MFLHALTQLFCLAEADGWDRRMYPGSCFLGVAPRSRLSRVSSDRLRVEHRVENSRAEESECLNCRYSFQYWRSWFAIASCWIFSIVVQARICSEAKKTVSLTASSIDVLR
jgi:hypothetical protein